MNSRVIVVLMVDGLRARALGAYGNTWHSTPAFDQLASEGTLFDRVLSDSVDLSALYDVYWATPSNKSTPLITQLRDEGFYCQLLTDEATLTQRRDCDHFDEVTHIESSSAHCADDVMECGFAVTLAAAADRIGEWSAEYEQPRLLWIHLQGLTGTWDAPIKLAESLLGDDDPPLESSTLVPDESIADLESAHDLVLDAACRYAGQIMALDQAIGAFITVVDELFQSIPVELVLAGTRGFALGEHGWLGTHASMAHRELFHVPLIVRGSNVPTLRRDSRISQASEVAQILIELSGNGRLPLTGRKLARGEIGNSRFVELNDWSYVSLPDDKSDAGELYVLPDDQWQANNVASICHHQASQLAKLLDGDPGSS